MENEKSVAIISGIFEQIAFILAEVHGTSGES